MKTRYQYYFEEFKRSIYSKNLFLYKIKEKIIERIPLRFLYQAGILFKPINIALALTDKCNLNCLMCPSIDKYSRGKTTFKDSDFKSIKRVLKQISKEQPCKVMAAVGEILLYKDFKLFIETCNKLKIPVELFTNGTILSKFAPLIVKNNCYELSVSIDGLKNTHDKIRGIKGTYQKAIQGIREINKEKKKQNSLFPKIIVNFTISNQNYKELLEFVNQIKKEEIDTIFISHLLYTRTDDIVKAHNKKFSEYEFNRHNRNDTNTMNIDARILNSNIRKIKAKLIKYRIIFTPKIKPEKINLYYNNPEKFIKRSVCNYPWKRLTIDIDGNYTIHYQCIKENFGNIEKQSIKEVWHNKKMKKMRDTLIRHKDFPVCSRCKC